MLQPKRILLCAALVCAACSAPARWSRVQADVGFGRLWETFQATAESMGYPPDVSKTDRGLRVYVSRWRSDYEAGFGMSRRTRLHGKFERPVDGSAGWQLDFYVQQQTVKDMRPGFEPIEEDWSDVGQLGIREEELAARLKSNLRQSLDIVPSYRRDKPDLPGSGGR